MQLIDRYAYSNRLRAVDPVQKVGLALLVMALCLLLDRPAVGLLAIGWMWGLASLRAGLPFLLVGRLLLVEGLFLVLAVVGVAISVGTVPIEGSGWGWNWGPLWAGSSLTSMEMAGRLAARALGCAAAMNFLALTTPLVDLIGLAHRLRMPALLIDLMVLVYRFIFALLDSLARMRTAQESRLGYVSLRQGMASTGVLASRLFLDAYHRSRRLQTALESRGYSGDLRVLPINYTADGRLWWVGAGAAATLLLAWASI